MRQECPHCNSPLEGEEIPAEYRAKGWYGDKTHYSRVIGHVVRGIYAGTLFWSCPDCGGRWHRFPPGDRLHSLAASHVGYEASV